MKTLQERLIEKYGDPFGDLKIFEARNMVLYDIPLDINTHIPALPNKIYCNKDLVTPFYIVMNQLIDSTLYKEIKTWDGCFNVRYVRGSKTAISIHSFALAIDLNASHNPLGLTKEQCIKKGLKPFTKEFDQVFRDNKWTCGIDFKNRPDGQHFQYTVDV